MDGTTPPAGLLNGGRSQVPYSFLFFFFPFRCAVKRYFPHKNVALEPLYIDVFIDFNQSGPLVGEGICYNMFR